MFAYDSYLQYSAYDPEMVSFSYEFVFSCLLGAIAFLYLLYFTSGAYVDFRKSKGEEDVSLLLTFVSFWFFPVGVFLMQPKLNEWQPHKSPFLGDGEERPLATVGGLLIDDLDTLTGTLKDVTDILTGAFEDWPVPAITLDDYEFAVSQFIGGETTEDRISCALTYCVDYSNYMWQAESLRGLLEVFCFYNEGISLKEIIAELKIKIVEKKNNRNASSLKMNELKKHRPYEY
ncbi:hypothetical protein [Pedobacter sp. NJ-S-72]